MKKISLLTWCLIFSKVLFAQNDTRSTAFIREVIIKKDSINYINHLDEYYLIEIAKALNHDTLVNNDFLGTHAKPVEYLVLTLSEKIFIQNKLNEERNFFWKPGLFPQSNLILTSKDTSVYVRKQKRLNWFKKIYSFSKPIFLRDNTICIFYSGYYCGGECGEGNLIVYRNVHSRWERWLYLYGWIS